jgi:hypothetical protein
VKPQWKTYTNTEHGFSLKYPANWGGGLQKQGPSEPDGIQVYVLPFPDCTTAADYAHRELSPFYPGLQLYPLPVSRLDGFMVKGLHTDNVTPGPEAFIVHCPNVFRIGFNPTGIEDGERVFKEILGSVPQYP